MTDLNALLVFAQVVKYRSFSEAARMLKMPVSTVSRRLAELEEQLGLRLIERSTRALRLTEVGAEVLEHAQRTAELHEQVESIASDRSATTSGTLRIAAPPSISDSLLAPLICGFQASYPEVRIHVFITERIVDQIAEGVDIAFRVGELEDSALVVRRLLTYRHRLVASPGYLKERAAPKKPQELLSHRLLAFSFWRREIHWKLKSAHAAREETVTFRPYLAVNEYSGPAYALLAGVGIGELPPIVQPELLREGRLVEIMPQWHFRQFHLSLVHIANRYIPRAVRVFKDFAAQAVPELFPSLSS